MPKLKPGIQPSTSLLVCKRACCLRWLESPVCHIHDVFPETRNILHRGTIYSRVTSTPLSPLFVPPSQFRCSTVPSQPLPTSPLHWTIHEYVYLPFLPRQFEVNSRNWLLSALCLRGCYVSAPARTRRWGRGLSFWSCGLRCLVHVLNEIICLLNNDNYYLFV